MTPTIQTVSGRVINFATPGVNDYDITDIAHGLSNVCRYGGQCLFFYSVAQHSVLVSRLVPREHAMEALMHDGTEAYMCDVPTPLKLLLDEYRRIERELDAGIRWQHSLPIRMTHEVHAADGMALAIEKPQLTVKTDMSWTSMPEVADELRAKHRIQLMYPPDAKALWLERYAELKYLS